MHEIERTNGPTITSADRFGGFDTKRIGVEIDGVIKEKHTKMDKSLNSDNYQTMRMEMAAKQGLTRVS
jgi:MoaA/NifB/PqqE/SkfB family radical SAM enzyme